MSARNIDDTELQRRIDALREKPIQTAAVSVEQRWVVTRYSVVVAICASEQEAEREARRLIKKEEV